MLARIATLSLTAVFAHADVHVPTREIAAGVQMPVISIGIGGLETANASAIVSNWLKLGGRGIDTALVYRDQNVVPQELQKAGIDRKDVFITTKIPGCDSATASVEYDLKQLQTDYIDLLLIHFPKGDCAKAWEVLESYHSKGVLKAIGVSNFDKKSMESLMKTAKVKPAVNQIELNVLEYDAEALAYSESLNITVEAFSPVGRSGHSGDIRDNKVVKGVAASHNISTYQVALKWIIQHGRLLTFQSSSAEHQASDAAIFDFELSDSEMKALDALHGGSLMAPIYM
ncbi:unnamed protein product [Symbiodinium pilosum]|uniref:NADP-dependent oxidoreductase domain-containing protein n=1 Tax=Symbiodinium pilosum TaxID=2952 RepID=A0A812JTX1_SYMPI|nr:unnamed protein product [Symbiodinium pilosum]